MPDFLKGADFLQTSVSSNNYSKSIIANFTIGEDATLYVAHSILVEKKPEWLLEYQTTNQFIKTRLGDFEIFSKKLKSGEEILLGNNGNTEAPMYFVAIQAQNKIRETFPKGKLFDVREFDAIGDGKTINTNPLPYESF